MERDYTTEIVVARICTWSYVVFASSFVLINRNSDCRMFA